MGYRLPRGYAGYYDTEKACDREDRDLVEEGAPGCCRCSMLAVCMILLVLASLVILGLAIGLTST